jgi:plastocyanin
MRKSFAIAGVCVLASFALFLSSCKGGGYGTMQPAPTGGELGSAVLPASGGNYSHTFNTVGTFHYKCTIHPSCTTLQGTVYVVSAATPILAANDVHAISFSGGSAGMYSVCSALSNQADSVHVGEAITWTNSSPLPHTVTSF